MNLNLKKLGLVAISGLFSLGVAEGMLRLFYPFEPETYLFEPGFQTTFFPDPHYLKGIQGPGHFSINRHGYRGKNPDSHAPEILCMGGSTTECLYLDDSETWYALMESELRENGKPIACSSAGKSGHTTREHLAWMKRICSSNPPDGLMLMCGLNDLMFVLSRANVHALHTSPTLLDSIDEHAFIHKNFETGSPGWRGTAIGFLIRKIRRNMGWNVSGNHQLDFRGKAYAQWRVHRMNYSQLVDTLPDLTVSLIDFKENLTRIIRLSKQHQIPLVLMEQASAWDTSTHTIGSADFWMGGIGNYQAKPGQPYYTPAALAQGVEMFNQALHELGKRHHLRVISLQPLQGRKELFYDDCHLNEAGAKVLADILIRANLPFSYGP